MVAIQIATRIIGDGRFSQRHVTILSHSPAAIKALSSKVTNSISVYDIHIVWVTVHSGISGNCRAEELTRRFSNLDAPIIDHTIIIDNAIVDCINNKRIDSYTGCLVRQISLGFCDL